MLTKLRAKNFKAVPYLETSALMQAHKGTLTFSTERPNVIIGPNGAGKSALLTALSLRFLTFYTGRSALDDKYVGGVDADGWWNNSSKWGHDWAWLAGLDCETDNAPARYYRPNHIPGNEEGITRAMMMGYFEEGRAYGELVADKSSGQQAQAVMTDSIVEVLAGTTLPESYDKRHWGYGSEPKDLRRDRFSSDLHHRAEVLKAMYTKHAGGRPLVMMDEPEQSLDGRAEARLWGQIAQVDCSKLQVVVATHSLYPLLHRDRFHIIEAERGYAAEVLRLMA